MPWLTPYLGQGATFDPTKAQPVIVSSSTNSVNLNAQPDAAVGVSIFGSLIQTTSSAGLPLTVTNISRDLLGPRFGFAWRPFGDKTVIRGGIGQYYQIESTNLRLNFNFIPFDFTQTVNATQNVVPTQTTANFFLGQAFGAGMTPANTPVSWAPLPEFAKMASNAHWSFGVESSFLVEWLLTRITWARREDICRARSTSTIPRRLQGPFKPGVPIPTSERLITTRRTRPPSTTPSKPQSTNGCSPGLWYTLSYTFEKNIDKGQQVDWEETASWRGMSTPPTFRKY